MPRERTAACNALMILRPTAVCDIQRHVLLPERYPAIPLCLHVFVHDRPDGQRDREGTFEKPKHDTCANALVCFFLCVSYNCVVLLYANTQILYKYTIRQVWGGIRVATMATP